METALLDLPISFFEYDHQRNTFGNVPTQKTTLRRMVKTRYYREQIEAIRHEPDKVKQDELKKYLPAFTPAALLNHRKKDTTFAEKVIAQHPLLMGDVDLKDNPGIDMARLKEHIPRLPYVLLCAYSVRGGLWFVVRLPEGQTPETLAGHFRYLQKLFKERLGVKLDSTKGGNATDLRFVSFDSEPFLNEEATEMRGQYTPPPQRPVVTQWKAKDPNDKNLLTRIVSHVQKAADGERHTSLLKASRVAGGYVGAGRLDEQTATLALETVASDWPNFSKSQKTIRDGIRNGKNAPIYDTETVNQPYARSPPQKAAQPKPAASKWDNPIIEYIPVNVDEELSDYPASWDVSAYQQPTVKLVPSPRRAEWAKILNVPVEVIPLLTLEPINP
ncbi:hypothetical protein GCM10027299_29060 [Larkinella ripae]